MSEERILFDPLKTVSDQGRAAPSTFSQESTAKPVSTAAAPANPVREQRREAVGTPVWEPAPKREKPVTPQPSPKKKEAPVASQPSVAAKAPVAEEVRAGSVVNARRVAEMKFDFYKQFSILLLVNVVFFVVSYLEIGLSGRYWFAWPAAFSVLAIMIQHFRAFVLKGRSIQGYIDSILTRMEEKEIHRSEMPR